MVGAVQGLPALDPKTRGANALDPRAHLDEAARKIRDLGLARGVFDQSLAAGKNGRHQGIMRRSHRDLGKLDTVAGQASRRARDDVASLQIDFGAERLEGRQVQIDGPRADSAAARQGDFCPPATRDERREYPEARPHARHHFVGRRGVDDLRRGESEGLAVTSALVRPLAGDGHVGAVIAEEAGKQRDVGKPRDVVQRQRLAGEKAGDHQGQRSVLGTADGYGAVQAFAADNTDTVHGVAPSRF
jgi:hypothetical protein